MWLCIYIYYIYHMYHMLYYIQYILCYTYIYIWYVIKSWFLIVKAAAFTTLAICSIDWVPFRIGPRLFFFPPPVWPWNSRTFRRHRDERRWSVAMKSFNWRFGGNMREPYLFIIQFWNHPDHPVFSDWLRPAGSFFNWDLAGICRQRVIQVPILNPFSAKSRGHRLFFPRQLSCVPGPEDPKSEMAPLLMQDWNPSL